MRFVNFISNQTWARRLTGLMAVALLSVSAWAVALSVGETLLRGLTTEGAQQMSRMGFKSSARMVSESFEVSLRALAKDAKPNIEQLRALVAGDRALLATLNKPMDQVSATEFAALHNFIAGKANRLPVGNRFVGAEVCLDQEAARLGIKVLARSVDETAMKANSKLPMGAELGKSILGQIRALGTRKGNKVALAIDADALGRLTVEEQQALFQVLERVSAKMSESPNGPEEKLLRAIAKFNGDDFTQPKLWMVFAEEMDGPNMERLTTVLTGIAGKDKQQRTEALRDWFGRSVDTPELRESFENLKRRNCWGLFPRAS